MRQALADGDFELAEALLGRPFRISRAGVAWAEARPPARCAPLPTSSSSGARCPLTGVYLVSCEIDGVIQPGVANIGVRPALPVTAAPHLEVHLLDFAGDLYGQRLSVAFTTSCVIEQRFASLEALKAAIDAGYRRCP